MSPAKAPAFVRHDVPESAYFQWQSGVLHCDGVSLEDIARDIDTPTFVYSARAIDDAYDAVSSSAVKVGARATLVAYAVKANGNLALLRRLASRGCGADIVSEGELAR
ncbi:MAG: diaminopimelate decarboxylase, partial [Polyangiales bacterium]